MARRRDAGRHAGRRSLPDDCVHCGFCLPACPTWRLGREEMDSPRGRIDLLRGSREGQLALDARRSRHFDRCLGCMACVTACPSGVRYDVAHRGRRGPQIEQASATAPGIGSTAGASSRSSRTRRGCALAGCSRLVSGDRAALAPAPDRPPARSSRRAWRARGARCRRSAFGDARRRPPRARAAVGPRRAAGRARGRLRPARLLPGA